MYIVIKALVSGVIIAAASEAARRSTLLGAIIISLPLMSIVAIVWLCCVTAVAYGAWVAAARALGLSL